MIKAVMFDMGGTIEDLYTCERNETAWDVSYLQAETSTPPSSAYPAVGRIAPLMTAVSVDFPEPLLPSTATCCPASIDRSMQSRAGRSAPGYP